MKWRAFSLLGNSSLSLQLLENYKIGFCGDWIESEGFGRVEGAILSGLYLADKFRF